MNELLNVIEICGQYNMCVSYRKQNVFLSLQNRCIFIENSIHFHRWKYRKIDKVTSIYCGIRKMLIKVSFQVHEDVLRLKINLCPWMRRRVSAPNLLRIPWMFSSKMNSKIWKKSNELQTSQIQFSQKIFPKLTVRSYPDSSSDFHATSL